MNNLTCVLCGKNYQHRGALISHIVKTHDRKMFRAAGDETLSAQELATQGAPQTFKKKRIKKKIVSPQFI